MDKLSLDYLAKYKTNERKGTVNKEYHKYDNDVLTREQKLYVIGDVNIMRLSEKDSNYSTV